MLGTSADHYDDCKRLLPCHGHPSNICTQQTEQQQLKPVCKLGTGELKCSRAANCMHSRLATCIYSTALEAGIHTRLAVNVQGCCGCDSGALIWILFISAFSGASAWHFEMCT